MSRSMLLCLALLPVVLAGNADGAGQDHEAVLAVIERAFDAVGSRDPDDMRAIQLAEGTSLSFRPDPNGKPGQLLMRLDTNEDLVANDIDDGRKFMERWTGDPLVMIRGPIAMVWGEYEFWIDGGFSHCGIDSVGLAKVDGDWKIANWMWTVEKDDCPTDPLS
jgi:hypothetical protein